MHTLIIPANVQPRTRTAGEDPRAVRRTAFAESCDENIEGEPVPTVTLRVNMRWPEEVSYGFVPPQLLPALPPLPSELQYRIIG